MLAVERISLQIKNTGILSLVIIFFILITFRSNTPVMLKRCWSMGINDYKVELKTEHNAMKSQYWNQYNPLSSESNVLWVRLYYNVKLNSIVDF